MSDLKPGTRCVIVAGCPENIGLIVEVVRYLGCVPPRENAYEIRTLSGRNFPQLWGVDGKLIDGYTKYSITDRHKLRPLIDPRKVDDDGDCNSKIADDQLDVVEVIGTQYSTKATVGRT